MGELETFWNRVSDAEAILEEGHSQEAFELLLKDVKALSNDDTDSEWICLRGYVHYCLKQREKALAAFQKALKSNPKDGYASLYIGHCLYDNKQYVEALAQFTKIPDEDLTDILAVKRDEIILCCNIIISSVKENRDAVGLHLKKCVAADDYPMNLERVLDQAGVPLSEWKVPEHDENSIFGMLFDSVRR